MKPFASVVLAICLIGCASQAERKLPITLADLVGRFPNSNDRVSLILREGGVAQVSGWSTPDQVVLNEWRWKLEGDLLYLMVDKGEFVYRVTRGWNEVRLALVSEPRAAARFDYSLEARYAGPKGT
jgi:hypothetical protein